MQAKCLEELMKRPLGPIHDLIFAHLDVPARRQCLWISRTLRRFITERQDLHEKLERRYNWLNARSAKQIELKGVEKRITPIYGVVDDQEDDFFVFLVSGYYVTSYRNCKLANTLVFKDGRIVPDLVWVKDESLMILCHKHEDEDLRERLEELYRIDKISLSVESCEKTQMSPRDLSFLTNYFSPFGSFSRWIQPVQFVKECINLPELMTLVNLSRGLSMYPGRCASNSNSLVFLTEDLTSMEMFSIHDGLMKWRINLESKGRRVYLTSGEGKTYCILLHYQKRTARPETLLRVIEAESGKEVKTVSFEVDDVGQVLAGRDAVFVLHGRFITAISLSNGLDVVRCKTDLKMSAMTLVDKEEKIIMVEVRGDPGTLLVLAAPDFVRSNGASTWSPITNKVHLGSVDELTPCCQTRDGLVAIHAKVGGKERISFFLVNRSPATFCRFNSGDA